MKNSLYLGAFLLAVALAYSASQTAPEATPPQQQQQANPGYSQPASPSQTMPDATATAPDRDKAATQGKEADESHAHAAADDSEIQKQVKQQLTSQNLNAVNVSVDQGKITLTGSVPTKEDRKRARELAKSVAGVKSVKDKLEISGGHGTASLAAPGSSPAGASLLGSTESQQNTNGSIAGNTAATTGTQAPTTTTSPAPSTQTGATATGGVTGQATGVSGSATGVTGPSTGVTGPSTGVSGSATGVTGQSTGASGSTGQTSTTTGATSGTMTTESTENTSEIQSRIDNAIKSEPTLTGSNVIVNVTADSIELSGSVPTGKEKQTADRIASSFAGNRKMVDRITVTGNGNANPASTPPPRSDQNPKH